MQQIERANVTRVLIDLSGSIPRQGLPELLFALCYRTDTELPKKSIRWQKRDLDVSLIIGMRHAF